MFVLVHMQLRSYLDTQRVKHSKRYKAIRYTYDIKFGMLQLQVPENFTARVVWWHCASQTEHWLRLA